MIKETNSENESTTESMSFWITRDTKLYNIDETVHIWVTDPWEESDTKLHNIEWNSPHLSYRAMGRKWHKTA